MLRGRLGERATARQGCQPRNLDARKVGTWPLASKFAPAVYLDGTCLEAGPPSVGKPDQGEMGETSTSRRCVWLGRSGLFCCRSPVLEAGSGKGNSGAVLAADGGRRRARVTATAQRLTGVIMYGVYGASSGSPRDELAHSHVGISRGGGPGRILENQSLIM